MNRTMRILTIDQGNSSAKAVVWEGADPIAHMRLSSLSVEELIPLLEQWEPEGGAFCSVVHTDAKFLESLRRLLDGELVVLTPSLDLPVEIFYGSRATLGADRVAAAIGAHSLIGDRGALVVDAGTAVTLDVVDDKGNFRGGNIAPGAGLRVDSLHAATSQLPQVDPVGPLPAFGTDTVTAIRCGVVRGMAGEVDRAFRDAVALYGCETIVITGSDASLLVPLLQEYGLPVVADADLVGRGLRVIFDYVMHHRRHCV